MLRETWAGLLRKNGVEIVGRPSDPIVDSTVVRTHGAKTLGEALATVSVTAV